MYLLNDEMTFFPNEKKLKSSTNVEILMQMFVIKESVVTVTHCVSIRFIADS